MEAPNAIRAVSRHSIVSHTSHRRCWVRLESAPCDEEDGGTLEPHPSGCLKDRLAGLAPVVVGDHVGAGMAEKLLEVEHVHAGVRTPGAEGVPEPVGVALDPSGLAEGRQHCFQAVNGQGLVGATAAAPVRDEQARCRRRAVWVSKVGAQ